MIAKFLNHTFSFSHSEKCQQVQKQDLGLLPNQLAGKILDLEIECEGAQLNKQLFNSSNQCSRTLRSYWLPKIQSLSDENAKLFIQTHYRQYPKRKIGFLGHEERNNAKKQSSCSGQLQRISNQNHLKNTERYRKQQKNTRQLNTNTTLKSRTKNFKTQINEYQINKNRQQRFTRQKQCLINSYVTNEYETAPNRQRPQHQEGVHLILQCAQQISGQVYITMRPRVNLKLEERNAVIIRSEASESDISDDISQGHSFSNAKCFIDLLDQTLTKNLRLQVNLNSERRENDFYVYEKKLVSGIKITEHSLIFSRKKLSREQVRVDANPLKLPNKLIYFEYECKF